MGCTIPLLGLGARSSAFTLRTVPLVGNSGGLVLRFNNTCRAAAHLLSSGPDEAAMANGTSPTDNKRRCTAWWWS